jgi:hypothetical protein
MIKAWENSLNFGYLIWLMGRRLSSVTSCRLFDRSTRLGVRIPIASDGFALKTLALLIRYQNAPS